MNSTVMVWLAWIAIGAVAGWIASRIMHNHLSVLTHIIVGILGAFIGGSLLNLIGATSSIFLSLLMAIIGAVVLLGSLRFVAGRRHHKSSRT